MRTIIGFCIFVFAYLSEFGLYSYASHTDKDQASTDQDFFTIGMLPDTQHMTTDGELDQKRENLYGMFDFFKDRKSALNLKMVSHLGDMTNNNVKRDPCDKMLRQWERINSGFDIFRQHNVPFSVARGNHDHPELLKTFFSAKDYHNLPISSVLGGTKGRKTMKNAYYLFSASGIPMIIIVLDWNPKADEYEWAQSILNKYKDHYGILISHSFNPLTDALIEKNDNILFGIMGHETRDVHYTRRSSKNRIKHFFVFDYQNSLEHTYGAVVKYFTFIPEYSRIKIKMRTYSIATQSDLSREECWGKSKESAKKCQKLDFYVDRYSSAS